MCAGVDHSVADEAVRQVWVVGMTVESKLQNTRSRKLKLVTQCLYIWSNDSQIFGDERQVA